MVQVTTENIINDCKDTLMCSMDSKEGIEAFLRNINKLKELTYYAGDYDALIMLIDFYTAFENCGLTEREKEVIKLVYFQDKKRVDVAKDLDVTKQTVQTLLKRGISKISLFYINYY